MEEKDWLLRMKNMIEAEMKVAGGFDNEIARQSIHIYNMFLLQINQRIKEVEGQAPSSQSKQNSEGKI